MNNISVMYVTEEEKIRVLKTRLKMERKAKRRMSSFMKEKIAMSITMNICGILCPVILGGEGICGTIVLCFLGLGALCAQEGDE